MRTYLRNYRLLKPIMNCSFITTKSPSIDEDFVPGAGLEPARSQ